MYFMMSSRFQMRLRIRGDNSTALKEQTQTRRQTVRKKVTEKDRQPERQKERKTDKMQDRQIVIL